MTEFADDVLPDTTPPVSDIEYPCTECGAEAGPYLGRGRRPTRCPEHKRHAKTSTRVPKVTGTNATLAAQAVEALAQVNGFLAIGAMLGGFHDTASAIGKADDGFREQAYTALLTDPDLCRSILRAGVKSGKIALAIAYTMFAASVFPSAVVEYRERKALKAARREMEENATGAANS